MGRLEYPQEFRRQAVELSRKGGRTQGQLAKELGVSSRQLRRWIRQVEAEEHLEELRAAGITPMRDLRVQEMEKKIRELEEANEALRESVRFLVSRRRK